MATTIGFIGLGVMGAPMARNLLKRGHEVIVWARRSETMAPLLRAGAGAGESAADLAARSDIIVTMVTDTRAVEEVVLGKNGIARAARRDSLLIDHSTIAPGAVRRIAGELRALGVEMLDAPVG